MAIRQVKVSDLDNAEGADVGAIVRDYPGIDQAKALDVTQEQADALIAKALKNVVTVELRNPDSTTREVLVTKNEFDKWAGNADEVLKNARGTRGRVPGSRVNGG